MIKTWTGHMYNHKVVDDEPLKLLEDEIAFFGFSCSFSFAYFYFP